jgi:sterol desaturase/sphingolipid hydroxylase (fatty acid hydroxylase superfamily)
MHTLLRYGTFPLFFLGFNGLGLWLVATQAPDAARYALLLLAVLTMLGIERLIPWQPAWNQNPGEGAADVLHALVNTALTYGGLSLLPLLASAHPWPWLWPSHWPWLVQLLVAVLMLDLGISAAHHLSHRLALLWRFHAVHHAAERLYGFNGWMKHPVHQLIETAAGMTPLLLLGVTPSIATAVAFCVAIQLLLQHANADYRIGPLKYAFATAEAHRFHHLRGPAGDVNFGLFTTAWDHLLGTFRYDARQAPRQPDAVGLSPAIAPRRYWAQLAAPFRRAA